MMKSTNNENLKLIDKLHDVLQRQIRMARKGDLGEVEKLTPEAERILKKISRLSNSQLIKQSDTWKNVEQTYKKLSLTLSSQKQSIQQQIQQIREGRKTLKAYKNKTLM